MAWIILGILLWTGAHLFKRVLPKQREVLGNKGKALVAILILLGIGLMFIGYGDAEYVQLYDLPIWAWYLNNILMLVAIFMMDVGRANGVTRTKIRHPMLLGVIIWATAHVLVNGDLASLVLFGGLGLWSLLEMSVINRAEGPWQPPARGSFRGDVKIALAAAVIYAIIVGIHLWLGYAVIAFMR
ncbi:MAG: NnrU family protein [Rhodospirillales bacterium]|jgi:uncharacterized membrane protein|nr:NnrU family protein [Rhodospirillales bacterium]MBT4041462.1 NnrU family protein [Rhodospirillales bacterium]MBT4625145.1 NnrU family protein [Rhodospirillales bacterium]MBT5353289.1 NnrU family protein [Rhodospirillales bacterium]MBT5519829.1 NnrU family protein [Rhodospirillales bacterium]